MSCSGPVSWLRLERFALGELDELDTRAVRTHVDGCEACRACLEHIRGEAVALPALPPFDRVSGRSAPSWWRAWWPTGAWASGLAAATAVLLWLGVRGGVDDVAMPGPRVGVKGGGTLVLSLVRERAGAVTLDATTIREDDRLKVRITCDRPVATWVDVVVYQGEDTWFPLRPSSLDCGNEVVLPGAFRITGVDPASICVGFDDRGAPDRARLREGAAAACVAITLE